MLRNKNNKEPKNKKSNKRFNLSKKLILLVN